MTSSLGLSQSKVHLGCCQTWGYSLHPKKPSSAICSLVACWSSHIGKRCSELTLVCLQSPEVRFKVKVEGQGYVHLSSQDQAVAPPTTDPSNCGPAHYCPIIVQATISFCEVVWQAINLISRTNTLLAAAFCFSHRDIPGGNSHLFGVHCFSSQMERQKFVFATSSFLPGWSQWKVIEIRIRKDTVGILVWCGLHIQETKSRATAVPTF